MTKDLSEIKKEVYDKCELQISELEYESESTEYAACRFNLNGLNIICRNAK